MNKQIGELLNKKMDRQEFLKHVGFGALALFGLGSIIKSLSSAQQNVSQATTNTGYGASTYGR